MRDARARPALVGLMILASAGGCIATHPPCVLDETAVVALLEDPLDLRSERLRTGETAIGDLIADAFFASLEGRTQPAAPRLDAALIDAGSFGDRNACGSMESLGPGELTLGHLAALLPRGEAVELVEMTGAEILRALEHGVAHLGEPGPFGRSSRFLHPSHLRFTVDCTGQPAGGDFPGARVAAEQVEVWADDGWEPIDLDATYFVATNTFLAEGGDGFAWLTRRLTLPTSESAVVAAARHIDGLVNAEGADGVLVAETDGRITLGAECR